MVKYSWRIKNYHPTEEMKIADRANRFFWVCIIISGILFGVYGFWVNYLELMPRAVQELSIPSAIMMWAFIMMFGACIGDTLSRKGKYIAGTLILIASLIITNTIWTLIN